MSLGDDIRKIAEKQLAHIGGHKEALITAWIAETGLSPSESVLCHKTDGLTTRVWVEKKEKHVANKAKID